MEDSFACQFFHDLDLFMLQMCELSCSESPVDRLSHVGLILKADSHVAVRLPIPILRPINGFIFIVIILVSDHVLFRLCRKTSSLYSSVFYSTRTGIFRVSFIVRFVFVQL